MSKPNLNKDLIITLSGLKGTGKKTAVAQLSGILEESGWPVIVVKLDDDELSQEIAERIEREISPGTENAIKKRAVAEQISEVVSRNYGPTVMVLKALDKVKDFYESSNGARFAIIVDDVKTDTAFHLLRGLKGNFNFVSILLKASDSVRKMRNANQRNNNEVGVTPNYLLLKSTWT